MNLESPTNEYTARILDLVAPIGFGQRGIVISPARTGKTRLIEQVSLAVQENHPNVHSFVLLVDQRPEDINEMDQSLDSDRCEVISSAFDEATSRHNDVALMVFEKAKRMVETGEDVVIIIDSLTNLARFELGVDYTKNYLEVGSLANTKSFLAAARRTERGGSLTILATVKTDSNGSLDDAIAESLRGSANLEIRLDRELAKRRIWPAINIHDSQTSQEAVLLGENYDAVCELRRTIGDMSEAKAMDSLLRKLDATTNNADLLSDYSS